MAVNDISRVKNGETFPITIPEKNFHVSFEIKPDGENPTVALILAQADGTPVMTMKNFVFYVDTLPGKNILTERCWNTIDIFCDGISTRVDTDGKTTLFLDHPLEFAIFGGGEKPNHFRGYLRNMCVEKYSGPALLVPAEKIEIHPEFSIGNESGKIIDLSGKWEFNYVSKKFDPNSKLPGNYPAEMLIPGFWDDNYELFDRSVCFGRKALTNPIYRPLRFPMGDMAPDASMPFLVGTGYYRKRFILNGDPEKNSVRFQLGPAVWGCTIFCNGHIVAEKSSYSSDTTVLLDEYLNFNALNELVIVISNFDKVFSGNTQDNNQHIGLAVRGYQGMRCGITRTAQLLVSGKAAITDAFVHLDENNNCLLQVEFCNAAGKTLNISVKNALEEILTEKSVEITCDTLLLPLDASKMNLWSDRKPELYDFILEIPENSTYTFRSGLRKIRAAGARIFLNDLPVYFRGTTEHYFYPETINAPCDFDYYAREIKIFKEYGFNFLRFHTHVPDESFLNAADTLGMLCQIEPPPHVEEIEWIEMMKLLRRHPSAVIVCGGNEENFDEFRIDEVKRLAAVVRKYAPGMMLFNPQEAMPLVEYRMLPDAPGAVTEPMIHNPVKLAALAEFSDVYGSYQMGQFSYINSEFDSVEEMERKCSIYGKPLLSHETGIIGGWLDFDNAEKYSNCLVPDDIYREAEKYLKKEGVFHRAKEFYRINSEMMNRFRKYTLENLRRCISINGYDFLGVYDAHWHRCGYPCGILDEFRNPKWGVSAEIERQSNGETVLLNDIYQQRNLLEKTVFNAEILLSHFGENVWRNCILKWNFSAGNFAVSGEIPAGDFPVGTLKSVGKISFALPETSEAVKGVLSCELESPNGRAENHWDYWIYPECTPAEVPANVKIVSALSEELIDFIADGNRVLLTDNFPADCTREKFGLTTTGRNTGHHGIILHKHPVLEKMANEGFADWNFYNMLNFAKAMDFYNSTLPFNPVIEYVPSYKLVTYKTPLCELRIGKGILMMCGVRFETGDCGGTFFKNGLLNYLANADSSPLPEVTAENMKQLLHKNFADAGVVKTDEAWDPNVSGGKKKR